MIVKLWQQLPGKFFCLATKDANGKFREHFFKRSELSDVHDFVKENMDKDVYFCPHGFSKAVRRKEYAELPNMLWADLDEAEPRHCKVRPTIAIESSPGRYVGLWLLDKPMTEDLNKRLTYFLEADRGGWDLTQVLRYPGTKNYKYASHPKVRLLWEDGPRYSRKKLEAKVPELDTSGDDDSEEGGAKDKYWEEMPAWWRREYQTDRVTPGKRSDVFWKMGHALVKAGANADAFVEIQKGNPWNKFAGRRNEDEQLRREYKKIKRSVLANGHDNTDDDDEPDYVILGNSMDDIEAENPQWLWYPYLARGEVTIVEGHPDTGKSYMCQMIAGHLCDGERLPSRDRDKLPVGKVAYFDVENDAARVTKKRLMYNDVENLANFRQEEEPFTIDDEGMMKRVFKAIERWRPDLVVFDTLNFYIGKADTGKANEVAQAITKSFKSIAIRFNCSVIILRHLRKSGANSGSHLSLGQGNMAIGGTVRIELLVSKDPDDDELRYLTIWKNNLCAEEYKRKSLEFRIESRATLKDRDRSKFIWGDFVDRGKDDVLSVLNAKEGSGNKSQPIEDATDFIKRMFAKRDEIPAGQIEEEAEKNSISKPTLVRAADKLGVKKRRMGFGKGSRVVWQLELGSL